MKCLITGGAGFQGSHLTEHLLGLGNDVTMLNTYSKTSMANHTSLADKVTVIWGSVMDPDIMGKAAEQQDKILHLAGGTNVDDSVERPSRYLNVNVV